jgi:hypothetical protein
VANRLLSLHWLFPDGQGLVLSIKVIALLNAVMLPDKIPVTFGGWLQFSEFLNVFYSSRTEYFWPFNSSFSSRAECLFYLFPKFKSF